MKILIKGELIFYCGIQFYIFFVRYLIGFLLFYGDNHIIIVFLLSLILVILLPNDFILILFDVIFLLLLSVCWLNNFKSYSNLYLIQLDDCQLN